MLTMLSELLISSYYNIVKRTMIDMVPKAVMLTLVQYVTQFHLLLPKIFTYLFRNRFTKAGMQRQLLSDLYRTEELDELLRESEYTIRRRKECQQMVESLSKANEIVSQVQ